VAQPPVGFSYARGLAAAATPVVLVTAFLAELVMWAALVSYAGGLGSSPLAMVEFLALPPVRTSLVDLVIVNPALVTSGVTSPAGVALSTAILLLFRAALTSVLIAALGTVLDGERSWGVLRVSARRAVSAFLVVLGLEVGYMTGTLLLFNLAPLFGVSIANLIVFGWLIGGIYYFVYCEIIAVLERTSVRASISTGIRAARLPGREHLLVVLIYTMVTVVLFTVAQRVSFAEATPSLGVWIYVLVAVFAQMGVLGTFVYRWKVIAEPVKAGAGPAPRDRRRPSMLSALGFGGASSTRH
jgi:hypothetical protein